MSTKVIGVIFILLLIIAALLFMGDKADAPAVHTMPDGTMMNDTDPQMGTMGGGSHTMPDGSVMLNTDARMETGGAPTPSPMPAEDMPMDHSMMGHSM